MNPRKELIKELSIEDNMSFLLELQEILPEIKVEFIGNQIENFINFTEEWSGYKKIREEEIIYISKDKISSNYFRFAIYFGNDYEFFYGIIGPWEKRNLISEVEILYSNTKSITNEEQWKDKYNNDWIYKYFNRKKELIYNSIRNGQTINIAINPLIDEFFYECSKLKKLLENTNRALIK